MAFWVAVNLFGPTEALDPYAMLSMSWRDYAFFYVCAGALPMWGLGLGVYFSHSLHRAVHKIRWLLLLLVPAVVGAAYFFSFAVPFGVAMLRTWMSVM
jgi:hypothetical protein